MGKNLIKIQRLVVFTSLFFLFFAFGFYFFYKNSAISIDITDQPYFGSPSAPLQLVLFEDFRCTGCKAFMKEILPEIQKRYVQTGKAKLVIIPVAFLEGSKDLSNAALCIYRWYPEGFFSFLEKAAYLPSAKASKERYLQIAAKIREVPLGSFQACLQKEIYFSQLERNYELGKKVMRGEVFTPTLYINEEKVSAHSLPGILEKMEALLAKSL